MLFIKLLEFGFTVFVILFILLQVVIPLVKKTPLFPWFRKSASLQADLEKAKADLETINFTKEVASVQAKVKAEGSVAAGFVKTEFAKAEAIGERALQAAENEIAAVKTAAENYIGGLSNKPVSTTPSASTNTVVSQVSDTNTAGATTFTPVVQGTTSANVLTSPAEKS